MFRSMISTITSRKVNVDLIETARDAPISIRFCDAFTTGSRCPGQTTMIQHRRTILCPRLRTANKLSSKLRTTFLRYEVQWRRKCSNFQTVSHRRSKSKNYSANWKNEKWTSNIYRKKIKNFKIKKRCSNRKFRFSRRIRFVGKTLWKVRLFLFFDLQKIDQQEIQIEELRNELRSARELIFKLQNSNQRNSDDKKKIRKIAEDFRAKQKKNFLLLLQVIMKNNFAI